MSHSVFLGLVTHPATRFTDAASETGLVHRLSAELAVRDAANVVEVCAENLYETRLLPLTKHEVLASIDAELSTEAEWRSYLNPSISRIQLAAFMGVRHLYRRLRLAPPWQREVSAAGAGARMLKRLVNIELAHLWLMRRAVETGSDWALLVEDDAFSDDVPAFAAALIDFMYERSASTQPSYVNVSASFTNERLRSHDLLIEVGAWNDDSDNPTRLLAAKRPFTNTVCAILYRTSFLAAFLEELESIPLSPVLPIDWKLNRALLNLIERGEIGEGDCWTLHPAPILQRSMHAPSAG